MISKQTASEYYCVKDKKHHEVSMAGQKKKCWMCGSKMVELKRASVITKGLK